MIEFSIPEFPPDSCSDSTRKNRIRVSSDLDRKFLIREILHPAGWAPSRGYANGVAVDAGRMVFIAGQVGWDAQQHFRCADLVPQFEQALNNVLEVLAETGA